MVETTKQTPPVVISASVSDNRLQQFISQNRVYLEGQPYSVGPNEAIDAKSSVIGDPEKLKQLKEEAKKFGAVLSLNPKPRFLFPSIIITVPKDCELKYIMADQLEAGGPQPRTVLEFDEETIALKESILLKGQRDPIDIYDSPNCNGKFRICEGHRRELVCFKMLYGVFPGGPGMWAIYRKRTEQEAYEDAALLNEKLPIKLSDKANFYNTMMSKFPQSYPTIEAVGVKVGASKTQISLIVSAARQLEHIAPKLKESVFARANMLPEKTLRPVKNAPEETKAPIVTEIVNNNLSSREAKELVDRVKAEENPTPEKVTEFAKEIKESPKKSAEEITAEAIRKQKEAEATVVKMAEEAAKIEKKTEKAVDKVVGITIQPPEDLMKDIYAHLSPNTKNCKVDPEKAEAFAKTVVTILYERTSEEDLQMIFAEADNIQ